MGDVARDIGAFVTGALGLTPAVITAGAGDDGVEVDGPAVDRLALGRHYLSAKLIVAFEAVLAEGETLSIAANAQDDSQSDFAGTPADYGDAFANAVVATGGTGGSTERGTVELPIDLSSARQFIRVQATADLSAVGTDTVAIAAIWVFGGADELPPV